MLLCCLIGFFYRSYFYSVLLMDLVHREETLYNVIRSVTRNGRSIILTGMPQIRPPLTERSFEVTGSNQKGAYIGKNSNVRFDSDLSVCHYHLLIFPRAVHKRNRRSIKWWRTNRRKSLWNIDFGHYNNIQWRFKKWGRYWRLSNSTFATSRSGKSWNPCHGFKDLLFVLDVQNISKTLSLATNFDNFRKRNLIRSIDFFERFGWVILSITLFLWLIPKGKNPPPPRILIQILQRDL